MKCSSLWSTIPYQRGLGTMFGVGMAGHRSDNGIAFMMMIILMQTILPTVMYYVYNNTTLIEING